MHGPAAPMSMRQSAPRGTAHLQPRPCLTRRRHVFKPTASLDEELQKISNSLKQLTDSVNRVEEGQQVLQSGQQAMQSELQALQSEFGELVERQLRGDIKDQHGGQYAKGLLARSIIDFVHLFKDRAIQPKLNDFQDRASLLLPAVQVLVDTKELESLVVSLHALLDRSGLNPGPWVINASNSEVDVRAFGTFLGSLENETLRRTFVRIKKYLVAQDKITMMQSCDGPGIVALISAALKKDGKPCFPPDLHIKDLNSLVQYLPSEELQLDCRGNLDVTPSKFAYIDIGEVKKGPDYSKAIKQLGMRLSVIAWLVHECSGVPDADIRRVGRLFIPLGKRQPIEFKEQQTALEDWQFSLYLHEI